MKALRKMFMSVAATAMLATGATASAAVLTNWYVDADGAGAAGPVLVEQYLDLVGQSFIANNFTTATNFSFQEVGVFGTATADGPFGSQIIPAWSSTFVGTGTGNVGGNLTFTTGTLTVSSGATTIAEFELIAGNGNLSGGTVLPNGPVSLIFQATSMESGYFFDSAMNDLAPLISDEVLFGFATTNAIPLRTGGGLADAATGLVLQNLYNANFDPDVSNPLIDQMNNLLLSNNGQFQINVVPEPGSAALLGLGLLAACFAGRRRQD